MSRMSDCTSGAPRITLPGRRAPGAKTLPRGCDSGSGGVSSAVCGSPDAAPPITAGLPASSRSADLQPAPSSGLRAVSFWVLLGLVSWIGCSCSRAPASGGSDDRSQAEEQRRHEVADAASRPSVEDAADLNAASDQNAFRASSGPSSTVGNVTVEATDNSRKAAPDLAVEGPPTDIGGGEATATPALLRKATRCLKYARAAAARGEHREAFTQALAGWKSLRGCAEDPACAGVASELMEIMRTEGEAVGHLPPRRKRIVIE